MNILVAADYATPQSGNFIASMHALGEKLRETGHSLAFIFPDCPNTRVEAGWISWLKESEYPVYLIDKSRSASERLYELQEIIRKHGIGLLHTHFSLYNDLILSHRKALAVKIIVHDHSGFGFNQSILKQRIYNLLLSARYGVRGIGMVSVNARRNRSYMLCRHWHVPNGLSRRRYVSHSRSREECRAELGFSPDDQVCLFLGWALRLKGLDIACKAIEKIHSRNPGMKLAVVGVGVPPSDKARDFLQNQVGVDPQAPWIRYLPDTEDMFAYHRMADVYLSASRTEGFSYGILETISEETPVAFSDIPGTRWVCAYNHGFMYPVEDANDCADAIQKALDAGRGGSNAGEIIDAYSIDRWCRRMIEIYEAF